MLHSMVPAPSRGRQAVPLSIVLTEPELKAWTERLKPEIYPAGQVIFYRGHHPIGLFIFCSGGLVFTRSRHESPNGNPVKPPALIGLNHMMGTRHYPLTAVITEKARLAFLPKSLLKEYIDQGDRLIQPHLANIKSQDLRTFPGVT